MDDELARMRTKLELLWWGNLDHVTNDVLVGYITNNSDFKLSEANIVDSIVAKAKNSLIGKSKFLEQFVGAQIAIENILTWAVNTDNLGWFIQLERVDGERDGGVAARMYNAKHYRKLAEEKPKEMRLLFVMNLGELHSIEMAMIEDYLPNSWLYNPSDFDSPTF